MWNDLLSRLGTARTIGDRHRIHAQVTAASTPHGAFYLMVVLSTTIAAFGLLADSTAVVIGAMLVAPLMGPIFGIDLSLANGSRLLLARAALSEAAGVVLCVALSALIGAVAVHPAFGPEILARTKPTLYDIVVALASGAAGAYAIVDEKISPALPGVAISTALVPPLTTCGLCLAARHWDWALGAFLLFFANFLAIEVAAAAVFLLAGMGRAGPAERFTARLLLRRFGLSVSLLVAVAVFLTHTLLGLVADRRLSDGLKRALSAEVRASVGAHLTDVQFRRAEGRVEVVAVVLTPQEFGADQVARIEENLRRRLDPGIDLVVRSLLSKDADRAGAVFVTPEDRRRRAEDQAQADLLSLLSQRMNRELARLPGARLADVRQEAQDGRLHVAAVVQTPTEVDPARVAQLEAALREAVGQPLRLTVRSVLTRDADAERYLYDTVGSPRPAPEERERSRRLERALASEVRRAGSGAALVELRVTPDGERTRVAATVRGPSVVGPRQVEQWQGALRRAVDSRVDLVVRSVVGADAGPRGYVSDFDAPLMPSSGR